MAIQTYQGSCHCKKVRFEVDIDLAAGTSKCNCTFCTKVRNWGAYTKPEHFRLLTDEADVSRYPSDPESAVHHCFCKHCGVRTFSRGDLPELGGPFVTIAIAALDGLTPEELVSLPVNYLDGLNDNWWNPPAETRHL